MLSAVESTTSQALQDVSADRGASPVRPTSNPFLPAPTSPSQLDSVATAMRAGGRTVKAAKRAVEEASKEARRTAQAGAGGKDAKSILKSILR